MASGNISERLYDAAKIGDLSLTQHLLSCHPAPDINFVNHLEDGSTPLHVACEKGHLEVVKLLLERGADFTLSDANGENAMHRADTKGLDQDLHIAIWSALLEHNPTLINVQDGYMGATCLMDSVVAGHEKSVGWLLDQGADPMVESDTGWTAWDYANDDPGKDLFSAFEAFVVRENAYSRANTNAITQGWSSIGEIGSCRLYFCEEASVSEM